MSFLLAGVQHRRAAFVFSVGKSILRWRKFRINMVCRSVEERPVPSVFLCLVLFRRVPIGIIQAGMTDSGLAVKASIRCHLLRGSLRPSCSDSICDANTIVRHRAKDDALNCGTCKQGPTPESLPFVLIGAQFEALIVSVKHTY